MTCKCELTGVAPQFGNKVSHSQRKTRRRFNPNLKNITCHSDLMGQSYALRVAARTIRTIEKSDGFDAFMLKANSLKMSKKAQRIKRSIVNKAQEVAA